MDSAREPTQGRLDAVGFWQVWQRFDPDEKGYIEEKELDAFFHHVLTTLGTDEAGVEENVLRMKEQLMAPQDVSRDGRVQMKELADMFLSEDENFLLLFRQESPLDSSVEFMQIWRKYDADSSGFISAAELRDFLRDLFLHHKKAISEAKLEEYTGTMMKIFDKNKDGRLDLNDLARQPSSGACSTEERKRDFEKIFAHYDVVSVSFWVVLATCREQACLAPLWGHPTHRPFTDTMDSKPTWALPCPTLSFSL
uniref:Secretagogin, EF-hand calcium binding protein n=1 Tax=Ursus americanus TaxID=9643 RepID=A0A452RHF4_URSAM